MSKAKNKYKEQMKNLYYELLSQCEAMSSYVQVTNAHEERVSKELHMLYEFLHYKNLEAEFTYFSQYAVEDPESEFPFPHLTLLDKKIH